MPRTSFEYVRESHVSVCGFSIHFCHFRRFAICHGCLPGPFPGKSRYFLGATTVFGDALVWPHHCAVRVRPREAVMLKAFKPLIAGVMFTCWIAPASVFGNSPTEQIQETIQQVLQVVNGSAGNDEERKDRLRETLMPRFDWLEMAKQSLGKHWNSASGRENEFVAA